MSGRRTTENVSPKFQQIAELAQKDHSLRFTSLSHLLTEEYLKSNLAKLNKKAVPGVDGVSMAEYWQAAESKVQSLHERLRTGRYRAQPVKRAYIPKAGGKLRPLGIPTIDDRIVQRSVGGIIETIYEPFFCEFSYGFRPGRSCHDALEKVRKIINKRRVRYVVDADIKSYFDTVNHKWLMKFLSHRIADKTILRLVGKWLKSGVMERGVVLTNDNGTPQGGPILPLLANIYLHYVLDLWFERRFKKSVNGQCELVRYADDFVVCFECKNEAVRFLKELRERFKEFQLELSEEKTRVVEFGVYSSQNGKVGVADVHRTFIFLGFTHYMHNRGKGGFRTARKPSIKSRNKFLQSVKEFTTTYRDYSLKWQSRRLKAKLQGYYNYFGLRYCKGSLANVKFHTERIWIKALRRRSQKHKLYWSRIKNYMWFKSLPTPRLR